MFYSKLQQPAVHGDNKRKARRNKHFFFASSSKNKTNHLYNQTKAWTT